LVEFAEYDGVFIDEVGATIELEGQDADAFDDLDDDGVWEYLADGAVADVGDFFNFGADGVDVEVEDIAVFEEAGLVQDFVFVDNAESFDLNVSDSELVGVACISIEVIGEVGDRGEAQE
jgi:hypothetical protein